MAVADVTCIDESEVVPTVSLTFVLPRFRFVVWIGSGVSSGVKSPVSLIGACFSVPYPAKDLRSEVNKTWDASQRISRFVIRPPTDWAQPA